MTVRYLKEDTSWLYREATGSERIIELLWGDHLDMVETGQAGARDRVRARGRTGYVDRVDIGDQSLLEVYFIDVGQGDGVLIRTPDDRHLMIDGGFKRASQPSGKNAADFVDWKFARDYGVKSIHLDAMIATHNDADHYGGLSDLLDAAQNTQLEAKAVTVDAFYHAGVGWWKDGAGGRWLGQATPDRQHLLQLMGDRNDVLQSLQEGAARQLQGEWARMMGKVAETKGRTGAHTTIERISHLDAHVPGFGPREDGGLAIRILAPVAFEVDGQPALRHFGSSASHSTNGNSVLLRLDYGHARILLTGDLNRLSQRALLDDYAGEHGEFACDVAKACHHGSDDISYGFLEAMRPAVSIISSGDTERHDHPRPSIVAASAVTGHVEIDGDRLVTPLVYSTELSRSHDLGRVLELRLDDGETRTVLQGEQLRGAQVKARVASPGAVAATTVTRNLGGVYIVTGMTYGLVNVRTDGRKIVCATLNEGQKTWQTKVVQARF